MTRAHDARLRRHQPHLPPLRTSDREIVEAINVEGIAITDLDMLGVPNTDLLCDALDGLAVALASRPSAGENALVSTRSEVLADSAVWQWGLRDQVLDLVENLIGLPVRYHGAHVRREVADGECADTRQWHRDIEDHRVLKLLVWINDVGLDGGPFEFLPRKWSDAAVRELRYVSGFVSDDDLARVVPRTEWRAADGPRWTAVVSDTAAMLHRARPPTRQDRYSVTFSWTSRRPITTIPAEPFTPDQAARIRRHLTPRQLACLPRALLQSG